VLCRPTWPALLSDSSSAIPAFPLRSDADVEDAGALRLDAESMRVLGEELAIHHLPPTALAPGRTTLADKFHAVMHACFLESGATQQDFQQFCHDVVAGTYDLGVEFSLPTIQPVPIKHLFPWFRDQKAHAERAPDIVLGEGGGDDFNMVAGSDSDCEDAGSSLHVSLASSLASPGLLHVIHNAAHDILSVSPLLSEAVDKLALVSEMLSDKGRRARLLETCFSNPVGLQLHGQLLGFRGRVYRGRWGSVAFCCRSILDVQRPLCWGWDLPRYMGDAKAGTDALDMDAALRSAQWWGAMSTLDALYGIIRHCFLWCEGCACHTHLLSEGAPQEVRKRWEACPLRGLRLPEVAAGSFFDMFRSLAERTAVSLFVSLPKATLSETDRADLLHAFERSRASMLHTFTLKLSCFLSPPLLLFATAHYSQAVAQEALRQCMESDCTHPLVAQLQQAPLSSQAAAFLEGWELAGLPELEEFIASLRFAHGVERQIEGGHAAINRRAGLATRRGEAWDSLALRVREITTHLEKSKEFLATLAGYVDTARSPKAVVAQLGMSRHPATALARNPWDHVYRKIVYHADVHTLFRMPLPKLQIGPAQPPTVAQPSGTSAPDAWPGGAAEVPGSTHMALMRAAALAFLRARLTSKPEGEDREDLKIFSCPLAPGAFRSLAGTFAHPGCRPAILAGSAAEAPQLTAEDLIPESKLGSRVWFSVVDAQPYPKGPVSAPGDILPVPSISITAP